MTHLLELRGIVGASSLQDRLQIERSLDWWRGLLEEVAETEDALETARQQEHIQAPECADGMKASPHCPGCIPQAAEKREGVKMETITCVYCGHAFPAETPAHGAPILREHIRICPQHPMREAEEKISVLRRALVGLVGVDGAGQLNEMEAVMRLMPAPMADKAASIDAIHALRATLPAAPEVKP